MKDSAHLRPHGLDSLAFIVSGIKPPGSRRAGDPEGYRAASTHEIVEMCDLAVARGAAFDYNRAYEKRDAPVLIQTDSVYMGPAADCGGPLPVFVLL